MSSQTSEHYGLLGIICTLHAIYIKYKLQENEMFGEVVIYIDNKTVVTRGNKEPMNINMSDYSIPDFELWALTSKIKKALPIKVRCVWVKGHQDTNSYNKKIHGPFSRPVQLNMITDGLAKQELTQSFENQVKKPIFSTMAIDIHDCDGVEINDMHLSLQNTINGPILTEYYKKVRMGQ